MANKGSYRGRRESTGRVALPPVTHRSYLGDELGEIVRSNTIHGIVVLLVEYRKFLCVALLICKTSRALHSSTSAIDPYLCDSEYIGEGCVDDDEENQCIDILWGCLIILETDVQKTN